MVTDAPRKATKKTTDTATDTATSAASTPVSILAALPVERLKGEVIDLGKAMAHHGVVRVGEGVEAVGDKLTGLVDSAPSPGDVVGAARNVGSPLAPVTGAAGKVAGVASKAAGAAGKATGKATGAVTGTVADTAKGAAKGTAKGARAVTGTAGKAGKAVTPGSGKDSKKEKKKGKKADQTPDLKVTNIVESVDVPVGREVAYDLWTQFEEFPGFMKKVETVKQRKPEEVAWRAQVFLSHRTWTATIVDQVRPEHIVWKSEGEKGRVDGAVTFHELAPDLTRVLLTLEYHPQGLFERVGNLWHAVGRRARLELKHFRRHVANHALLHQDDVEGWEGEIHDGQPRQPRKTAAARKSSAARTSSTSKKTSPARKTSPAKKTSAARKTSPAKKTSAAKKSSTTRKSSASSSTRKTASKRPAKRSSTAKKTAASKPRKTAASKSSRSASSRSRSTRSRS